MKFRSNGLTVVEVLVALTIVGVVVAVLTTVTISSVRHDANSGSRTQAVQILSYLGRLASVSDPLLLGGDGTWGFGELRDTFTELRREARNADPDLYRAEVESLGQVGIGSGVVELYRVTVCWRAIENENCVQGDTAGPVPSASSDDTLPPVVN